jgi:hypothetical protein
MVTLPVLVSILAAGVTGSGLFGPTGAIVGVLAGSMVAWVWWSWSVPKWRRWALSRGAPADRLQRLAAMTLLVWPKGWIFERTEFRSKDSSN